MPFPSPANLSRDGQEPQRSRGVYNLNCMYSAQMLDHFQNPRNAGEVVDPDAVAEIENPACGDVLRLTLKIAAGRIAEIRFKARGCVASIACGSALTELVAGRTLDEVRALQGETLLSSSIRPSLN